jgi:uncharacterized protein YciW
MPCSRTSRSSRSRPHGSQREDVEALRAAGFDDRGILQIAQITSFFAYFNRMADGLGVGRP